MYNSLVSYFISWIWCTYLSGGSGPQTPVPVRVMPPRKSDADPDHSDSNGNETTSLATSGVTTAGSIPAPNKTDLARNRKPPDRADVVATSSAPLQNLNTGDPSWNTISVQTRDHSSDNGLFSRAHDFVISNSTITEIHNIYPVTDHRVLRQLADDHTIPGIAYDSSARYPAPLCHPGTRKDMIETLTNWLRNANPGKKVFWLYGPAGVGKTAIMQTIAESEASRSLGASLFFSRSNQRDDRERIITTIVYQLTTKNPLYRRYVIDQLYSDPKLLETSMSVQFQKLIVTPFADPRIYRNFHRTTPWSIFLDGLDEHEGERTQCDIVKLICEFSLRFPDAPLVWILASRPEHHLEHIFSQSTISVACEKLYVPADSSQACLDVEDCMRKGFDEIRQNFPDSFNPAQNWPPETQFLEILSVVSGLFALASTIIKFIGGDTVYGDPVARFDVVFLSIRKSKPTSLAGDENPLLALNALYSTILSSIPPSLWPTTKLVLGYFLYFNRIGHSASLVNVSNVLGLSQSAIYGALQRLHSVVNIPKPDVAHVLGINFHHTTFPDYLRSLDGSHPFTIGFEEIGKDIWCHYFRILHQANNTAANLPESAKVELSWPSDKLGDQQWQLYCEAKKAWINLTIQICPGPTPPDSSSYVFRGKHIKTSELLDTFRQINFNNLTSYFHKETDLPAFWYWITSKAPLELRHNLVKTVNLGELDLDRVRAGTRSHRVKFQKPIGQDPRALWVECYGQDATGRPAGKPLARVVQHLQQLKETSPSLTVFLLNDVCAMIEESIGGWCYLYFMGYSQ